MIVVLSCVLALLIFAAYYLWYGSNLNENLKKALKLFVDLSPVFIWMLYRNIPSFIFLSLCLLANIVIFQNNVIGAVIFIMAYSFGAIWSVIPLSFNLIYLIISFVVAVVVIYNILKVYKENQVGVIIYGFTASLSCLYAFFITWNFGFLALVVGDTILMFNEVSYKKSLHLISNFFYFLGVCLVPVSLKVAFFY